MRHQITRVVAYVVAAFLISTAVVLGTTAFAEGADEACVPVSASTETINHEAVTHVESVMTDPGSPAVEPTDAVPAVWANWSPNNTHGPQNYVPIWPEDSRGTWQIHDEIPNGHAGPDGVYQTGGGNSPWFYREAGSPSTPGKDAVPPTYEDVVVVDKEAWVETVNHPAITCDPEVPTTTTGPAPTFEPGPVPTVKPVIPTVVAAGQAGVLPNVGGPNWGLFGLGAALLGLGFLLAWVGKKLGK